MSEDFIFKNKKSGLKNNPIGLKGFSFIEVAAPNENHKAQLTLTLQRLGFKMIGKHKRNDIYLYGQGNIKLLMNCDAKGRGAGREGSFVRAHGLCASAFGIWVEDADQAYHNAILSGAKPYKYASPYNLHTINGIGDTLIYFVDGAVLDSFFDEEFVNQNVNIALHYFVDGFGLSHIDHLTFTLYPEKLNNWSGFFQKIFNFRALNYTKKSGVCVRNMTSPCGSLLVTLMESDLKKISPVSAYLNGHMDEGISHIAFATTDLEAAVDDMTKLSLEFEDLEPLYYQKVVETFPMSGYSLFNLSKRKIMVDGDTTDLSINAKPDCHIHIFVKKNQSHFGFELIERKKHFFQNLGNYSLLQKH
jgi:4-hydroxyphenylpyruvate dioxygenase